MSAPPYDNSHKAGRYVRKEYIKQLHGLSYFKAADEDRLDLLLEFDDHTLKNLSYDLIII